MPKLWKLKSIIPQEVAENLSAYPKLLAQLLYNRGLTDKNQVEDFLDAKYEKLHDPFLFKDMQKAVDRIWLAIERGEKICIYGDYDADAVTANAVLLQTFRYLGVQAASYIPDRFSEGYGVNLEALEKIKSSGAKIIITVDCGTNSVDAAEFCRKNNIDLIITDHHEIIGEPPKAYALINPKNPDDSYPEQQITGVGVAFKLACGILSSHNKVSASLSSRNFLSEELSRETKNIRDPEPSQSLDSGYSASESLERNSGMTEKVYKGGFEKWLLDLVAIGTVADCHSLMGENRILVKYGLKVLTKTKWIGLRVLVASAALDFAQKLPDTYTLGFTIAPRLNAAGRLEHADIALNLLLESDLTKATEQSLALELINQRRQQLTQTVLSEAKEKVLVIKDRKVLALVGEGWPKGVMGLVAGRLAEEYYKPVIVLEQTAELCTGSARTAGEFNLIEALKFSSEHLVRFGGHKQAAGLTVEKAKFELFYQKILEHADLNIDEKISQRVLELEAELDENDLDVASYNLIASLEPFGVGNPKPKFFVSGVKILSFRPVGATGQHTQYNFQKGQKTIAAIAFNSPMLEKNFKVGDSVDVAAELIHDNWNGNNTIKLKVTDLRAA